MTKVRCAIYTRKSSDEGLDQEFNSLHAQREACEAYVRSQKGEGWSAIATAFDDGGFSGGSMERPALKTLMAEIEAGRVDVVVVYKIDRLTRSLMDFARMVEVFDRRSVSFVSVTQSFNTTTSMGRLTLNVLLSFAQFEREVTGERIRDKIAASKAKGIWMGGRPALGYTVENRSLVAHKAEVEVLRHIFTRYLQLGSVHALKDELDRDGYRSKAWTTQGGKQVGGYPFSVGGLFHLLKNRLFLGEVVHKGVSYPGRHEPIIERDLFEAVQAKLAAGAVERSTKGNRSSEAPLRGLIYDADDRPMTPTFGYGQQGKTFRYYASAASQSERRDPDAIRRVSASQLEALVRARLASLGIAAHGSALRDHVDRVQLRNDAVEITFDGSGLLRQSASTTAALAKLGQRLGQDDTIAEAGAGRLVLRLGMRPVFRGGRTWLVNAAGGLSDGRTNPDRRLIGALRQAHEILKSHNIAPASAQTQWGQARSPANGYQRKVAALAFLAPDIQQAITDGRQPPGMTFSQLLERGVPASWAEQRRRFGFPATAG